MRLVFLGPPGAGKGTQAKGLTDYLSIPHVSTGNLLREVIDEGTPIGRKVREIVEAGRLVPDDLMLGLMSERFDLLNCREGYLLDGFPRTETQAEAFDARLAKCNKALHGVLLLGVDDEKVVERLSERRVCRDCTASYHLKYLPPARDGLCDRCGGELYQRDDDRPETIRHRLGVYHTQTAPLIEYYKRVGLLHHIDGEGTVDEVASRIRAAVDDMAS